MKTFDRPDRIEEAVGSPAARELILKQGEQVERAGGSGVAVCGGGSDPAILAGGPGEGLCDSHARFGAHREVERLRIDQLEGEHGGGLRAAAFGGEAFDLGALGVVDPARAGQVGGEVVLAARGGGHARSALANEQVTLALTVGELEDPRTFVAPRLGEQLGDADRVESPFLRRVDPLPRDHARSPTAGASGRRRSGRRSRSPRSGPCGVRGGKTRGSPWLLPRRVTHP